MSRRFYFLWFWLPLARLFLLIVRATQMAWARDPISGCIHIYREGMVLLDMHIFGV